MIGKWGDVGRLPLFGKVSEAFQIDRALRCGAFSGRKNSVAEDDMFSAHEAFLLGAPIEALLEYR